MEAAFQWIANLREAGLDHPDFDSNAVRGRGGLFTASSRKQGNMGNSEGLREAEHEVHILHCLPGRALHEIVRH